MIKQIAALVCMLAVPISAFAVDVPQSSKFDTRIQYADYNSGDVFVIRAMNGIGSRVVFAPSEKIEDIATGFSQGWELQNRGNILYLKPKSIKVGQGQNAVTIEPTPGKWNTNLMVRTTAHLYDFDLKLLPVGKNSDFSAQQERAAYRLQFRYPIAQVAAKAAALQKQLLKAEMDRTPTPRNWKYSMQVGDMSSDITPTMAYDDGRFTYIRIPENREFPAVFTVAQDKTESLVNAHIDPKQPDVLVIHRVARELVLRLGNEVVAIYNDAYNASPGTPETGTTVPGMKRVVAGGQ